MICAVLFRRSLFTYGILRPNEVRVGISMEQIRFTSFFNKLPAEALWKGVTSVSNAGKKRGRGKGARKKMMKDLNKGQIIGVGKVNMVWPGLTTPVFRGKELVEQQQLPPDPEREEKLLKLRNSMGVFRRLKLLPSERGWSGNRLPGRSIGPPDPIGDQTFEGFDTKVLESKSVFNMTGNMGRKRQMSVFVVTGNGNGLAGFGLGKALEGKTALANAKNRAGQRLMYIERFNDRTVFHNFHAQFGQTQVFVKHVPEGYGLVCHRAIRNICEVVGIKDIYAKLEGSHNLQHIVKAFFLGLLQQKSHQELADETGYHVVEFRKETNYFPNLLTSPLSPTGPSKSCPSFDEYVMRGRVQLQKKKFPPFYQQLPGWTNYLKKTLRYRNQEEVFLRLKAEKIMADS
ncbi:28S ribosomal protein S5, mitochondrial [Cimex lectularius]|uniref:Small ribosomal subunit protein uS5m n=1 Tax=Cimex lectularius TaxID=79782 RepID=A0A8I6S858_CIMLE|nr:28S ribosomal protein S5, mitochondrial [Cimex lectularius]